MPSEEAFKKWRAKVDKELAGKSFEKALVTETPEGISIQPLYIEAPKTLAAREPPARPFQICIRTGEETVEQILAQVRDGADAIWGALDAQQIALMQRSELAKIFFVFDGSAPTAPQLEQLVSQAAKQDAPQCSLGLSPLDTDKNILANAAKTLSARAAESNAITVSTIAFHDAGAEPGFEIACALSSGVHAFRILLEAGLGAEQAARQISLQISIGRDTFLELCKLRALHSCWRKLLIAVGAPNAPRGRVHAVCSDRTLTERDPWVNMLRVTTQMFAAILGGADLITPHAFDLAFGEASKSGERVARNTGLVLREESMLGRVADPAGGSYALETLTDALARKAWEQFQALEKDGGIAKSISSGELAKKLEASWQERLQNIRKRKLPVLGVSEFANLDERLPRAPKKPQHKGASAGDRFAFHRDAEAFEDLRWRAESRSPAPVAALLTLGEFSESRARVGFASSFFAAGGIRTKESSEIVGVPIICLCGTDERYASEAVGKIRSLKEAGAKKILLAGRPGPLEKELREAGCDGFIHAGCDAVEIIANLLSGLLAVA